MYVVRVLLLFCFFGFLLLVDCCRLWLAVRCSLFVVRVLVCCLLCGGWLLLFVVCRLRVVVSRLYVARLLFAFFPFEVCHLLLLLFLCLVYVV